MRRESDPFLAIRLESVPLATYTRDAVSTGAEYFHDLLPFKHLKAFSFMGNLAQNIKRLS